MTELHGLTPDPEVWRKSSRRGSATWYKVGDDHNPYTIKLCAHCGREALITRTGRFCSRQCAKSGVPGTGWITRSCGQCGIEFQAPRHNVNKGDGRFCSRACGWASQRKTTVRYARAHEHIYAAKGKASEHACVDCGQPAAHWSYDGNDSDELTEAGGRNDGRRYSLKPEHYNPRCHGCHVKHDGLGASPGEANHQAKLTEAQVRAIRARVGATHQELADEFGVSPSIIGLIRRGDRWKYEEESQ
jgi:hypothetical protein